MPNQKLVLFWSMPPDKQDWDNLALSGCRRVMLPFWLAAHRPDILKRLAEKQKRVTLRIEEDTIYDSGAPQKIRVALLGIRSIVAVDAVILGCEPDNPFHLEYGSPGWGQEWAYKHRAAISAIYKALAPIEGIEYVTPGWTMHSISEDEQPIPGRATWAEITRMEYDAFDGNAVHLYQYGWSSIADELRFKFALKEAIMLHHKPIYIDELNISSGTQLERMRACIEMAKIASKPPFEGRVEMISFFVSNGTGVGYDPRFVMRDPAAYKLLGEYVTGV